METGSGSPQEIEIVTAELERLFELDELVGLSRDLLGFDPETVGRTGTRASFAAALVAHCAANDALEALCDALIATRPEVSPEIESIRTAGLRPSDAATRTSLGRFTQLRQLAVGPLGTTYVGVHEGVEYRVKVLEREVTRDRRGFHRFTTATRLIASVPHPGLPKALQVGSADDATFVAHEHVQGASLATRMASRGPQRFSDARGLLTEILSALASLHERRIAHGNLKPENIIIRELDDRAVLVDAATDRLGVRPRSGRGPSELFAISAKSMAPEQLRGSVADARSDLYAFGALAYELLCGRAPFVGPSALAIAVGHLSESPQPPSAFLPAGALPLELEQLLLSLLAKDPESRPQQARVVLQRLEGLGASTPPSIGPMSAERLATLRAELTRNPADASAAASLEIEATATDYTHEAGDALIDAARTARTTAGEDVYKALLARAARVFASRSQTRPRAEPIYEELLELAPEDGAARSALKDVRRRLLKYEELIEMLLADGERAESAATRAKVFAEIGAVYEQDLQDRDQAVVAFTQAFCEAPSASGYALDIERLCANRAESWSDVLQTAMAAADEPGREPADRAAILNRVGRWWYERAQKPELAVACFQGAAAAEPGNDTALEGLAMAYRNTQQWAELGQVLARRAELARSPGKARDLRSDAAEILEVHQGDIRNARLIYEAVLSEDPGHVRATAGLARIYERSEDHSALVLLLERTAEHQPAGAAAQTLCRAAEIYEQKLSRVVDAAEHFKSALDRDPSSPEAFRGVVRTYSTLGRFPELLRIIDEQIERATTPRQRVALLERAALIHSQEFLDHARAAEYLERLLTIDPGHVEASTRLSEHLRTLERWQELEALYERRIAAMNEPPAKVILLLELATLRAERLNAPERAAHTYDLVLSIEPEHPEALRRLAEFRESSGDAQRAISAIEALAERAATPVAKAEQWVRAAKLAQSVGDGEGAIERYKRAIDAAPHHPPALAGLRQAYAASGDVQGAIQVLDREIAGTEGPLAKAELLAQVAKLYHRRLHDAERAEEAAKRSLQLDPGNVEARVVLAELAFDAERFLEASRLLEGVTERAEALDADTLRSVLARYAEALARAGSPEKAVQPMERLLSLSGSEPSLLRRAADVLLAHGTPARAAEVYADLLERFDDRLTIQERAAVRLRYAEALERSGDPTAAVQPLEEAADLDPSSFAPLVALARAHESGQRWGDAIKVKTRHLDMASGEERVQLLLDIAELYSAKLGDRAQATKSLAAALEEKPDDRRLLTKLMQLYGEEKDWNKLVEVVARLADFVDDPKQRAKYLHTAAMVTARQIGDSERAIEFYERVLELEPSSDKALAELIDVWRKRGDHAAVERSMKRRLELATAANDPATMIEAFDGLGELYERDLGWTAQAVDALEAAQTLEPGNSDRNARLRRLYSTDVERYLDKAVRTELEIIRHEPQKGESYRVLRRLYTEAKRADEAWCLCQALSVLGVAEADEERFFKRMRADTAAPAQMPIDDETWLMNVMHQDADPLLTSIFALIEPAVIARRGATIEELGYDDAWLLNLVDHPSPICQSIYHAAGVLGIAPPPCFENPNDAGGLTFLFAVEPSLALGSTALRDDVPLRLAAFIAAQKVAYLRPGMYVRHLLASGTALKAWLLGAIQLTSPAFPIPQELEGAVKEASKVLDAAIHGPARDHLTRVVAKLVTSDAALDLKRWVGAVDLTADRAGLLIAHDLTTAVEVVRASDDGASAVPTDERINELILYSVSPEYFAVRRKLGITVDS